MKEKIAGNLKTIEESFTYLGVLKNIPLMESMQLFQEKFEKLLKIFESVWENGAFPDVEQLFESLGEDYGELTKLTKIDDVIKPIGDSAKNIFDEMIHLRESGISFEDAREKLITINNEK